MHIIVVGAGIGGLQAALALAAQSFTVTVLESVPEFVEVGAGIRVPPNSILLSQSFGVDFSQIPKCISLGNRFVDWKGKPLLDVPFKNIEADYKAPYYFLHRADLVKLLLDTARSNSKIEIRFGAKVVDYNFSLPAVTLDGGQQIGGDLIVCADGIKSEVRDIVNGKPCPPLDTGDVAYRILVPAEPLLEAPETRHLVTDPWATHWIGPSAHAVGYPLRGGKLYNIIIDVTHDTDPSPPLSFSDWMQKHSNEELVTRFKDWCPEVQKILSLTGTYLKWRLADFDQLDTWIHPSNTAVLLGDACHPMPLLRPYLGWFNLANSPQMPYMAQGAAQACEDAACLATCLARFETLVEALQTYERRRLPRAAYIARNTRVLQEWWHVHDGPLKDQRDEAMGGDSPDNPMFWAWGRRRDWLFGHDARDIDATEDIPPLPPQVNPEQSVYKTELSNAKEGPDAYVDAHSVQNHP